jgi:hypothetical protein
MLGRAMRDADEEAFRSNIGRMTDQYRKLITGAAAADTELARLESRLPGPKDDLKAFKAKAVDFIKEMESAKNRYLTGLEKQNKDVKDYKEELVKNEQASKPASSNSQVTIEAPDGSRMVVPQASVQKYINKGGKLVK